MSKELNGKIEEYFNILCKNDYPKFINRYLNTNELQRLKNIGLFCGCDYTKLYDCTCWFSRLDHSIACALMVWNFTKDKTQTLTALFHDIGTPAFSHCVDYLLKDYITQESSEKNIKDVLLESVDIIKYLEEDNIKVEDVINIADYTILENKRPKICVDRLEGIFSTGWVWCRFWELKDIKKIYNNIQVLDNEYNEKEIGFTDINIAEYFYEGAFKYSIVLQKNENKFAMQFIADNLKFLIENNIIKHSDLYKMSERQIINLIIENKSLKDNWNKFVNMSFVYKSNDKPNKEYFVALDTKKRYVLPLIRFKNKNIRLDKISIKTKNLLQKYLDFKDKIYGFSDIVFKLG